MDLKINKTIIVIFALVFSFGSIAMSASVVPVLVDPWTSGNASSECAQTDCTSPFAYKVDAAAPNGNYMHAGNTITISNSDSYKFDWASEYPVCAVIVKAGTGAYIYYYYGAYSDTDLDAPDGKQISHVTFCFGEPEDKECATISGIKFHDRNASGDKQAVADPLAVPPVAAEELLSGWTIKLWKLDEDTGDWVWISDDQTDENGAYSFTVYEIGTYKVEEVLKDGWKQTAPATICHLVVVDELTSPDCKDYSPYDFGNIQLSSISGYKFKDCNADGVWDEGEVGIEGWTICLYGVDILGNVFGPPDDCIATNIDGYFKFGDLLPGVYQVCEDTSDPDWAATTDACVDIALGVADYRTGINFGNVPLGRIIACKFYDINFNKVNDDELPVPGIEFELWADGSLIAGPLSTDENGCVVFTGLWPGSYKLVEVLEENWIPTTPTVIEGLEIICGSTEQEDFGNVQIGCDGGGHTPGFWSNKNGERTFGLLPNPLVTLTGLPLADAAGNDFDPLSYVEFRIWLLASDATNMAYKLSTHLAAMVLNVEAGFVDPGALVYAPDVEGADEFGFISIGDLIAKAVAALGADKYTPAGDPNRDIQEVIKDALDNANNNENFLCLTP
jgi:hypothetical protein